MHEVIFCFIRDIAFFTVCISKEKLFFFIVKSGLCKTHSLPMNFFFFLLSDKPNHVLNAVG